MRAPTNNRGHSEHGFTMVELMVTVLILGVLMAIAVPVYLNQKDAAVSSSMRADLKAAVNQITAYYGEHEEYPGDLPPEVKASEGNRLHLISNGLKRYSWGARDIDKYGAPYDLMAFKQYNGSDTVEIGMISEMGLNGSSYIQDISRLIAVDPANHGTQYLQGLPVSDPAYNKVLGFNQVVTCTDGRVSNVPSVSLKFSTENVPVRLATDNLDETYCAGSSLKTYEISTLPVAQRAYAGYYYEGPNLLFFPSKYYQDTPRFCVTVSNPRFSTTYKYDSLDPQIQEGVCTGNS